MASWVQVLFLILAGMLTLLLVLAVQCLSCSPSSPCLPSTPARLRERLSPRPVGSVRLTSTAAEPPVWSRRKESSSVQSGGNREPALVRSYDQLFYGSEQSKYIQVLIGNSCKVQTVQTLPPDLPRQSRV